MAKCQSAQMSLDQFMSQIKLCLGKMFMRSAKVSRGMKKPRKIVALAVFGVCVARAAWHQVRSVGVLGTVAR